VIEIERKFLAVSPDLSHPALASARALDVEQTYLEPDERGGSHRVRRVAEAGHVRYYETVKRQVGLGTRHEDESEIDAAAAAALLSRQLPQTRVIRKRRLVFEDGGHTWELDCFDDPPGLFLLEVELESLDVAASPPGFIRVVREVTDDDTYSNAALARLDTTR
jgi:CYTH domain-containing protein